MTDNEIDQELEKTRDKTARVGSWALGLFFLAASFADLDNVVSTPTSRSCYLLITCLLLPPIRALFYRISGRCISIELRTALCLGLWFLAWPLSMHPLEQKIIEPSHLSGAASQSNPAPAQERLPN